MYDKKTIVIVALLLVGVVAGYLFGSRNDTGSERAAYKAVVGELDQARRDSQYLNDELNRSAAIIAENDRRIASLEERTRRAEANASAAYGILQQNDALIAEARRIAQEDQRILRDILEGSESKNKSTGKKE